MGKSNLIRIRELEKILNFNANITTILEKLLMFFYDYANGENLEQYL